MHIDPDVRRMKIAQVREQRITTGFVVRKSWKTKAPDRNNPDKTVMTPHIKTVSRPYTSRDAADVYRRLAEKDFAENPVDGQLEVRFYTTENVGTDGLPKGF